MSSVVPASAAASVELSSAVLSSDVSSVLSVFSVFSVFVVSVSVSFVVFSVDSCVVFVFL